MDFIPFSKALIQSLGNLYSLLVAFSRLLREGVCQIIDGVGDTRFRIIIQTSG